MNGRLHGRRGARACRDRGDASEPPGPCAERASAMRDPCGSGGFPFRRAVRLQPRDRRRADRARAHRRSSGTGVKRRDVARFADPRGRWPIPAGIAESGGRMEEVSAWEA